MERCYAWTNDDPVGIEHVVVEMGPHSTHFDSLAIGSTPFPYRVQFQLEVDDNWITRRLDISSHGDGWKRHLELRRSEAGVWAGERQWIGELPWIEQGVEPEVLPADILDVDVQYSPVTNLMPVRRLGLDQTGKRGIFTMAWVAVPHLEIYMDEQIYTILNGVDPRLVHYESGDGSFAATIECDSDGVVLNYPSIGHRLGIEVG